MLHFAIPLSHDARSRSAIRFPSSANYPHEGFERLVDRVWTLWLERKQTGIVRLHRGQPGCDVRDSCEREKMASRTGSRWRCILFERTFWGPSPLPGAGWKGFFAGRWPSELWPRKHFRDVLHDPRLGEACMARSTCNTSIIPVTTATAVRC